MARQVLPIVGAIVGAYFGNPQLGWAIGSAIGNAVDPQIIKGPSIGDIANQTSQEGVPRPIVFGLSQPISGNIIVSVEPRTVRRRQRQGKGGPKVETESVFRTFAIRICEGPISQVVRVWKNNQLVYDSRPESAADMADNNTEFLKTARFFLGDYTQNPSPDLEALYGVGTTPAHRGTAYMVVADEDLTDMRGAIPQYQFQVLNNGGIVQPLGSIDLDAITNASVDAAGAAAVGIEVDGLNPGDTLRITRNVAGDYVAWSPWGVPALSGPMTGSMYRFNYLGDGDAGNDHIVEDPGRPHDGYAAAAAAFDADHPNGVHLTGYSSYLFYFQDTPIEDNSGGMSLSLERVLGTGSDIPLAYVVSAVCQRAGMDAGMFDVSELDDVVAGLTIINTYPAYAVLQSLSQVFFFAPSNYDGVLHFVPGGANSVATITENDMLDDEQDIEQEQREDSISVPRVMHLLYFDTEGGLAADKQTSERAGDRRSIGEKTLQSAVMMHSTQSARVVAINHKLAIEALRGTLRFSLPDNWLRLVPSDPVIVQWNGHSKRARITKLELMDGYQQYELLHDRQSAYTSNVEGIPAGPQTPPPSSVVGPTVLHILDIHILIDADDNWGLTYYAAVSGVLPAWQGAQVELSIDGGENYISSATTTTSAIVGSLLTELGDHPQVYPDEVNTVQVQIDTPFGELEETDLVGMLNGENLAIIGDELIQFAEADEISEGVWELSYFLRGRKGTDPVEHSVGTRFVLLDRGSLSMVPASISDIGRTLTFRATSFGTDEEDGVVTSIVYEGRSQIEREPAYLEARREGDDAIVTWQGVGRLGGGATVAQGLRFAGYRVTFNDGATEVSVDTQDEELVHDVSALLSPLTIYVVQLNDLTGAGPAAEVILE